MTEKPIRIPVATRVMPSVVLDDITSVSPMVGPVMETACMITERPGEGQVDIDVDPATGRRTIRVDVGSMPAEQVQSIVRTLQEQSMITEQQGEGQVDLEADIAYFRKKLEAARLRGDDARVQKLEKQISLLEDSVVVYRLTRPPQG